MPTGIPLLKIEPVPDVYAIPLSSILFIRSFLIYLISPFLSPLPTIIAWTLPGVIETGIFEFKSVNNNTLEFV